jgi:hypothetical protein
MKKWMLQVSRRIIEYTITGVTLSVWNSPRDHKFGSSGLNLTFEGLLLVKPLAPCKGYRYQAP